MKGVESTTRAAWKVEPVAFRFDLVAGRTPAAGVRPHAKA